LVVLLVLVEVVERGMTVMKRRGRRRGKGWRGR
jgi:hypothetical protein